MSHINKIGKISDILLTPLKKFDIIGGDVFHGMKSSDNGFDSFGEIYVSFVKFNYMKGWKRHKSYTMNIIVPIGEINFFLFDDRSESISKSVLQIITLSKENYMRITIPPKIWFAFKGMSKQQNMLINIVNNTFNHEEVDSKPLSEFSFSNELLKFSKEFKIN